MTNSTRCIIFMLCLFVSGIVFAEDEFAKSLTASMAEGQTINEAVAAEIQANPDKAEEILSSAVALASHPTTVCAECLCDRGGADRQYDVEALEKEQADGKEDIVQEVERRYIRDFEQPMLSQYQEAKGKPFFYHTMIGAAILQSYLQNNEPSAAEIALQKKKIQQQGFDTPVRVTISRVDDKTFVKDGQALLLAAMALGIEKVPTRFLFVECAVCPERFQVSHYRMKELRQRSLMQWAEERFFKEAEFLLLDEEKTYSSEYNFRYHMQANVQELRERYVKEEPDQERQEYWMEKLRNPLALDEPLKISFHYWNKSFKVQNEEAAAIVTAAEKLGMKTLPVQLSFLDRTACTDNKKRTVYSSVELFMPQRLATVKARFFEKDQRLIEDKIGRELARLRGYPFGEKIYPYHAMVKVQELLTYLAPEDKPSEDRIQKRLQALEKEGVKEPVYVVLEKDKEKQTFDDAAVELIYAAEKKGLQALPVRMGYIASDYKRLQACLASVREVALAEGLNYKVLGHLFGLTLFPEIPEAPPLGGGDFSLASPN